MFAAMRRASSRVSRFAAVRAAGLLLVVYVRERLPGVIAHDETGIGFLDGPGGEKRRGDSIPNVQPRTCSPLHVFIYTFTRV